MDDITGTSAAASTESHLLLPLLLLLALLRLLQGHTVRSPASPTAGLRLLGTRAMTLLAEDDDSSDEGETELASFRDDVDLISILEAMGGNPMDAGGVGCCAAAGGGFRSSSSGGLARTGTNRKHDLLCVRGRRRLTFSLLHPPCHGRSQGQAAGCVRFDPLDRSMTCGQLPKY